ncbi:hypothetical protein AKL17_4315 [Frigidibacter mobilis]|uniref:Uncharacterized protein n=1 Tax=Frigidibacter mobilis TaxID=1335048 RepID=A0A159Z7T1_9RHOB|nr:hypothetical protein AKL17_4315 [Frigidibacter mobilis]
MLAHLEEDVEIPAGPPRIPASPSPARRMRVPVSTPAGMLTDSERSFSTRPAPWQTLQGFLMVWPSPPQVGQVRSTVKKPCWARTLPMPEQVGQTVGSAPPSAPVPEQAVQATEVGTVMVFCAPRKASSSEMRML